MGPGHVWRAESHPAGSGRGQLGPVQQTLGLSEGTAPCREEGSVSEPLSPSASMEYQACC